MSADVIFAQWVYNVGWAFLMLYAFTKDPTHKFLERTWLPWYREERGLHKADPQRRTQWLGVKDNLQAVFAALGGFTLWAFLVGYVFGHLLFAPVNAWGDVVAFNFSGGRFPVDPWNSPFWVFKWWVVWPVIFEFVLRLLIVALGVNLEKGVRIIGFYLVAVAILGGQWNWPGSSDSNAGTVRICADASADIARDIANQRFQYTEYKAGRRSSASVSSGGDGILTDQGKRAVREWNNLGCATGPIQVTVAPDPVVEGRTATFKATATGDFLDIEWSTDELKCPQAAKPFQDNLGCMGPDNANVDVTFTPKESGQAQSLSTFRYAFGAPGDYVVTATVRSLVDEQSYTTFVKVHID